MEGFLLETEELGNVTVIKIKGSSNPNDINKLEKLFGKMAKKKNYYCLLDLSETRLLNSHDIGVIIKHIQNISKKDKNAFAFVNPSDRIRYLLELTCAIELAPVYKTIKEAVEKIQPPA